MFAPPLTAWCPIAAIWALAFGEAPVLVLVLFAHWPRASHLGFGAQLQAHTQQSHTQRRTRAQALARIHTLGYSVCKRCLGQQAAGRGRTGAELRSRGSKLQPTTSALSTAMELTTSSWTLGQPPASSRGAQIITGLGKRRLKETWVKLKRQPLRKLSRILVISRKSGDKDEDGPIPYLARQEAKLFARESIGAEHGEGFATFRTTGPLHVDVDFLNDRMREKGLQRIRYAMKPDEAFGLIFSWDNVLLNTHALRMGAWTRLAAEEDKPLPTTPEKQRQLLYMDTRTALHSILDWGDEFSDIEIKRLSRRLATLYTEELSLVQAPMEGLSTWLGALFNAGVPCAITSSMDRLSLLAVLQRLGLLKYFRAFVTEEDGMDSIAHMFLSAAVKLDRPPSKCVVFEDDPRGVAAAHNCTMKAVALIGSHPAYELTQADLAVSRFADLSVMNLRRLFANKGAEFMDLQKQADPKKPAKRRLMMDTWF